MGDVATIPLFLNREGAPVPSAGATPVKCAALSFGIERGTAGQAKAARVVFFLIRTPVKYAWHHNGGRW